MCGASFFCFRQHTLPRALLTSALASVAIKVVVESRDKAPGTVATMHVGKLSLVDLAGSER